MVMTPENKLGLAYKLITLTLAPGEYWDDFLLVFILVGLKSDQNVPFIAFIASYFLNHHHLVAL